MTATWELILLISHLNMFSCWILQQQHMRDGYESSIASNRLYINDKLLALAPFRNLFAVSFAVMDDAIMATESSIYVQGPAHNYPVVTAK